MEKKQKQRDKFMYAVLIRIYLVQWHIGNFYNYKRMISDSIQIVKTDGQFLSHYQSNPHLPSATIKVIVQEVIEHSRKLNIEAYDHDIIEIISQGCYVYFRNHRSIIIIVIVCSSYSYEYADQLIPSLINIYDETLQQAFGEVSLPKYLSSIQLEKLKKMNYKIEKMVKVAEQQKNEASIKEKTINSQKLISMMSDGYFENRKTVSPMKEEEKVEEAKSHRNQTRQILWIMRSKKYALFLLILANILLGLYFFASHFTDVSFI